MAVYYLVDLATYTTLFEFDCEVSERSRLSVQWTKYPIEAGSNVSDFGYVNPEVFEQEGFLSSYPLLGGYTLPKTLAADKALVALAKAKQVVTMIGHYWATPVVIDECERVSDGSVGDALRVKIKAHTVEIPTIKFTAMPPARMKPKVKRRAAPKKKGGAGAKKPLDAAVEKKYKAIMSQYYWLSP